MRRMPFLVGVFGVAFVCLSTISSSFADDAPAPVATIRWDALRSEGRLKSGELIPGKEGQAVWLKIVNKDAGMQSIPLLELEAPAIKTPSYAIRGKVRYENVVGVGFLEMWNHFGKDQAYFSRTMGTDGPMRMVTGTSPERDFELPFHTMGKAPAPKKLVINLVLNGPGTVEIGPLELVPIEPLPGMEGSTAWWGGSAAGLVGGIGGSILGVLGGIFGTLVGLGKAKKVVLTAAAIGVAAGVVLFLAGIVAVIKHQPYEVYYVLLMGGGMVAFFGIMTLSVAPGRYRDHELRRMQALDI